MKNAISVIFGLLLSTHLLSQSINYAILENNAEKAYTNYLAIDFMGVDMDVDFNAAGIYVGASGRWGLNEKFALEGLLRPTVYNISGKGFGLQSEVGLFMPLKSKSKNEEIPVILKYDAFAGETIEGYRVEETKFIKVPGTMLDKIGPRGGLYFKKSGYGDASSATLGGVYLGFQKASQAYVKTMIDSKMERIGGAFARIYGDFLILPARSVGDPGLGQSVKKDRIWGWRAGIQWYLDAHDGEYKRLGKSIITAEIGSKPFSGLYINMAWGWAIISK